MEWKGQLNVVEQLLTKNYQLENSNISGITPGTIGQQNTINPVLRDSHKALT